jgi:hypothetical protein
VLPGRSASIRATVAVHPQALHALAALLPVGEPTSACSEERSAAHVAAAGEPSTLVRSQPLRHSESCRVAPIRKQRVFMERAERSPLLLRECESTGSQSLSPC